MSGYPQYRYLVTQPDLNAHGTLHGGILMKWVDEACGMEAKLRTARVCATRHISSIDFTATARAGDIIEISVLPNGVGKTSVSYKVVVRNAFGGVIATVDNIVFVAVDEAHNPITFPNNSTEASSE